MIYFYIFASIFIAYLLFYRFIFLRDNKNQIPEGNNIVSPCSGKVIHVGTIDANTDLEIKKRFLGGIKTYMEGNEEYYLINIFMSAFDVHFTKMPYDGEVIDIQKNPGKFLVVNTLKAGLQNENQEFLIQTEIGTIKVIQIAGLIARTCRSFIQPGTSLKKGQKMGIILLGSQTSLLFPKRNYKLNIKVGDKVSCGETIISDITD